MAASPTIPGVHGYGTHANKVSQGNGQIGALYFETDTFTLWRDNGTTWDALAIGIANPMSSPADLIVGGTAGAPARLAKGADGQVLTVDPTTHLLVWATPSAGGALTSAGANLSADVAMSTANAFYDGPTVSLVAGTWIIWATALISNTGAGLITGKLWDGTTVSHTGEIEPIGGGVINIGQLVIAGAIVTPASTTTYKLSCTATVTTCTMLAAARDNGAGNNATFISALKIV